ncbi:MAG: HNH endonuclease, partial [Myxococcota bacterium]
QSDGRVRLQHRIFERDGWRCAVPGCTSYRNLQVHHVVFRSQGGDDEPENLITLCAWHHQRGVHGGLVRITGRAPDRLRFELGLRDGEPPLAVYDSGDRLLA